MKELLDMLHGLIIQAHLNTHAEKQQLRVTQGNAFSYTRIW